MSDEIKSEGKGNVSIESNYTNTGLYSGNVVIEFNTDQKVVKPVIKVNEKAEPTAIYHAINMALLALRESKFALESGEVIYPDPLKNVTRFEDTKKEADAEMYSDNDELLHNDNSL